MHNLHPTIAAALAPHIPLAATPAPARALSPTDRAHADALAALLKRHLGAYVRCASAGDADAVVSAALVQLALCHTCGQLVP